MSFTIQNNRLGVQGSEARTIALETGLRAKALLAAGKAVKFTAEIDGTEQTVYLNKNSLHNFMAGKKLSRFSALHRAVDKAIQANKLDLETIIQNHFAENSQVMGSSAKDITFMIGQEKLLIETSKRAQALAARQAERQVRAENAARREVANQVVANAFAAAFADVEAAQAEKHARRDAFDAAKANLEQSLPELHARQVKKQEAAAITIQRAFRAAQAERQVLRGVASEVVASAFASAAANVEAAQREDAAITIQRAFRARQAAKEEFFDAVDTTASSFRASDEVRQTQYLKIALITTGIALAIVAGVAIAYDQYENEGQYSQQGMQMLHDAFNGTVNFAADTYASLPSREDITHSVTQGLGHMFSYVREGVQSQAANLYDAFNGTTNYLADTYASLPSGENITRSVIQGLGDTFSYVGEGVQTQAANLYNATIGSETAHNFNVAVDEALTAGTKATKEFFVVRSEQEAERVAPYVNATVDAISSLPELASAALESGKTLLQKVAEFARSHANASCPNPTLTEYFSQDGFCPAK